MQGLRHVHFGAGKLGPRLLAFFGTQARLQVTLVGRRASGAPSALLEALLAKTGYLRKIEDGPDPAQVPLGCAFIHKQGR